MISSFSAIGQTLRAARRARGMSQSDLAQRVGMRQSTISNAEAGRDLRLGTLVELSRALDLEPILAPRRLLPAITAILGNGSPHNAAVYTGGGDEPYTE